MDSRRSRATTWLLVLACLLAGTALAQSRQERAGLTMYWGLVPAAVVAERHPGEELHGGAPKGGGQVHHLVVALYDTASGRRVEDAIVRAQLSEAGIVDAPPKYLLPMKVNEQASYGQVFGMAKDGPYRFRIFVKLPQRPGEIEFAVSARSPHRTER
jgi:hypothetical protein